MSAFDAIFRYSCLLFQRLLQDITARFIALAETFRKYLAGHFLYAYSANIFRRFVRFDDP